VNPDPTDHPYSGPVSRRRKKPVDPTNFNPGHTVHWVQAKKAAETLHEAEVGRIVRIDQPLDPAAGAATRRGLR
jgi:hypothetical protein